MARPIQNAGLGPALQQGRCVIAENFRTIALKNDAAGVAEAARLLRGGELVALPTETVYGLGADATNDRAVAAIYEAKGRPQFNPLIIHVPSLEMAQDYADISGDLLRLAQAFWPGPLTVVAPRREGTGLSHLVTAGLDTVAVRVPQSPVALAVLEAVGRPIAAPSANPSGLVSASSAAHVMEGLGGKIAAVLDDGPCTLGLESTIVGGAGALRLLRPGGLPREAIEACLGRSVETLSEGDPISAPGQLASHYAPSGSMRLNAAAPEDGEVLLGFGPVETDYNLSPSGDLHEAASRLFGLLHAMNAAGVDQIAVSPVPEHGLGVAINDRLRRAAAPRG